MADVNVIAGDAFEGRGPGSEGDRKARTFLAGRLAEMDYEPLFEGGSYEQPVDIVCLTVKDPSDMSFTAQDGSTMGFDFADE